MLRPACGSVGPCSIGSCLGRQTLVASLLGGGAQPSQRAARRPQDGARGLRTVHGRPQGLGTRRDSHGAVDNGAGCGARGLRGTDRSIEGDKGWQRHTLCGRRGEAPAAGVGRSPAAACPLSTTALPVGAGSVTANYNPWTIQCRRFNTNCCHSSTNRRCTLSTGTTTGGERGRIGGHASGRARGCRSHGSKTDGS